MNKILNLKKIQYIIDYPCRHGSGLHDFQLVPPFKKGICECLHCSCTTSEEDSKEYDKYRLQELYGYKFKVIID
ncbi:MAG: hypothetical protein ACFFDF_14140 [Candidatus Odinarchaeota archaeon]